MNAVMHYQSSTQARKIAARKVDRLKKVLEARAQGVADASHEHSVDQQSYQDSNESARHAIADCD